MFKLCSWLVQVLRSAHLSRECVKVWWFPILRCCNTYLQHRTTFKKREATNQSKSAADKTPERLVISCFLVINTTHSNSSLLTKVGKLIDLSFPFNRANGFEPASSWWSSTEFLTSTPEDGYAMLWTKDMRHFVTLRLRAHTKSYERTKNPTAIKTT